MNHRDATLHLVNDDFRNLRCASELSRLEQKFSHDNWITSSMDNATVNMQLVLMDLVSTFSAQSDGVFSAGVLRAAAGKQLEFVHRLQGLRGSPI